MDKEEIRKELFNLEEKIERVTNMKFPDEIRLNGLKERQNNLKERLEMNLNAVH